MFNIDKQKFGSFITMLRKEKGLTQKELAKQLSISDKAVSKWETAASVPSIDLLIPLADLFGVTVTELLMCQRMEQDNHLSANQVEQVVKTAIAYSEEKPLRPYQRRSKWVLLYLFSLLIACLEIWYCCRSGCFTIGLGVSMSLTVSFGLYFCVFAREKLPAYYDENRISVYQDGFFEMSLPGLSLNNQNWGRVLKVSRIWAVSLMLAYPVVSCVETMLFTGIVRDIIDLSIVLLLTLGGLFLPIYHSFK